MLSYQHGFHAGCFADVVKHVTLSRLLTYMTQKNKPLLYVETHAGRGIYNLKSQQALKTGEAKLGIEQLWSVRNTLPLVFKTYIQVIQQLNNNETLHYYPGSPKLAIELLRSIDRLCFNELHPKEFEYLEQLSYHGKRVFCQKANGFDSLKSLLPPIERRGLIFIDPSYEIKTDYRQIGENLQSAYKRFATGTYCLWYPLIDKKFHDQLLRGLNRTGATNNLRMEFYLNSKTQTGMTGCGLWIINPPYVLANELKIALKALCEIFNPQESSFLLD